MQRSFPLHRSIVLVCLSLSAGFGVQALLLPSDSSTNAASQFPGMSEPGVSGPGASEPKAQRVKNRLSPPEPVVLPQGKVVVDLSDRKVYLYALNSQQEKELKAEYSVAIGQEDWETPIGDYEIGEMQKDPAWEHPLTGRVIPAGPDNPLGAAWISFLSEGDYSFGLHGTINESLIGEAVSHGCIRMRNADILSLYDQVEAGWPLQVRL